MHRMVFLTPTNFDQKKKQQRLIAGEVESKEDNTTVNNDIRYM